MSESRPHKQHEIEDTDDMIDYISNLPDCILHHILSSLLTKEVVQTSVISKRWKNLWASVPNLNFDDSLLYANEDWSDTSEANFLNFVDRTIRSRDASKIDKFRLSCRFCTTPLLNSWISIGIMHNVRELDLCLSGENSFVIPQSLFDCKSLVVLKIIMFADIEIPSLIYLPCLKTLHLSRVTLLNDDSTKKLFSSSPVLEELVLIDCDCVNLKSITIFSLSLKRLTIDDLMNFTPSGCKIKIDAKNLTYLKYSGNLEDEIFLNNVSSLVKAHIHIPFLLHRQKEIACRAVDLLKGLHNVVFLTVCEGTMETFISAGRLLKLFPAFPNLSHLVVTTGIRSYNFEKFMDLLHFFPTLQSICLSKGFNCRTLVGVNDSTWTLVPICISSHLKNLTFNNFHAKDLEICFLKHVLKHACFLEKLDVWWCKPEPQQL